MDNISLDQASRVILGALADSARSGYRPMGIVVVDTASQVVVSAREDGASALRLDIAEGKACAAMSMGVNTRELAGSAAKLPVFFSTVAGVATQAFIPHTGAVLICDGEGAVLGAAGASGGTGDEDEQIVIAGITAAGLKWK